MRKDSKTVMVYFLGLLACWGIISGYHIWSDISSRKKDPPRITAYEERTGTNYVVVNDELRGPWLDVIKAEDDSVRIYWPSGSISTKLYDNDTRILCKSYDSQGNLLEKETIDDYVDSEKVKYLAESHKTKRELLKKAGLIK